MKHISKPMFSHLRDITKIRKILTQSDVEKLNHVFVTSRLNDCDFMFVGYPKITLNCLQLIQHASEF